MEQPPSPLPPNEDHDAAFMATITVCWGLGAVFVCLRFFFRYLSQLGAWWDDWFILAALIISTGTQGLGYGIIRHYVGHHIYYVDEAGLPAYFKANFVASVVYNVELAMVKFSILCFYYRIFSVSSRKPIFALGGLVAVFTIAIFFVIMFQCKPIEAAWNPVLPGKQCLDSKKVLLGGSIPNIVTDALIIVLPISYVYNLKMPLSQRLAVVGVFGLGIFVTVASITRLVAFWRVNFHTPDHTYAFFAVCIWSAVETNVAIICACLPTMKPLLSFCRTGRFYPTEPPSHVSSEGTPHGSKEKKKRSNPVSSLWSKKSTQTDETDIEWDSLCANAGNATEMENRKVAAQVNETRA